jgi:predicted DNA-binding transcriptional regulator YafY
MEEEDRSEKGIQRTLKESYQLNLKDFNSKSFRGTATHHNTLKKSLRDDELIEIKYNGGSQKNQFRPIRPISLIPRPQGLCLYAHCLQSDLFKFYLLKKIPEIRKLNKTDEENWNKKLKNKEEKK